MVPIGSNSFLYKRCESMGVLMFLIKFEICRSVELTLLSEMVLYIHNL
jgi:hypothetical protein